MLMNFSWPSQTRFWYILSSSVVSPVCMKSFPVRIIILRCRVWRRYITPSRVPMGPSRARGPELGSPEPVSEGPNNKQKASYVDQIYEKETSNPTNLESITKRDICNIIKGLNLTMDLIKLTKNHLNLILSEKS